MLWLADPHRFYTIYRQIMKDTDKKRVLREMLFARRFEDRCYEAYVERSIGGFLHLYPGEEACAFGVL